MGGASGTGGDGQGASLTSLADTLEGMADQLATVLPDAPDEPARSTLDEALERISQVCSSLRSIALLQGAEGARQFARHGQSLRDLSAAMGDSIAELAQANQRVATKMDDHVRELDAMAELPAGEELAARLRGTMGAVRSMASEMQRSFVAVAERVRGANKSIAVVQNELRDALEKAFRDPLTQLHSRAALDERLDAAFQAGSARGPWCLLLIDIDRFKDMNDRHGHLVGDAILYKVARALEAAASWKPDHDLIARYGGEEFVIVYTAAGLDEGRAVAELVREKVAASRWATRGGAAGEVVHVTVSIGVAQHCDGDTASSLIQRADDALYQAKRSGRDQVVAAELEPAHHTRGPQPDSRPGLGRHYGR